MITNSDKSELNNDEPPSCIRHTAKQWLTGTRNIMTVIDCSRTHNKK